jgi:gliding motility-associated-like protein
MKNIFTLQEPTFLNSKKLMALALFFYMQTIFILPAIAQDPVVTNSATYDVFMNLDPSRGLNPTNFATDVSTYLNTLGAASGSYRITTSAVTLDPTDVTKWEVYDHYDYVWYANQAAWSASPAGFNNGNIPSNWYYYGVNDPWGTNGKTTIAQLLANQGTWGQCGNLQSHIYPFVANGKPAMQFYGYSQDGAADFLYYPADVASTKTVKFDVDAQLIDTHTLTAAGFLINGGTSGSGASKTISGYLLLIDAYLNSVKIYKLNNVNVDALHNSGAGALGILVATYSSTIYSKSHIELSITSTSVTATIQQTDGSGNHSGPKSTMFNSQAITNSGFGGFGPFVLYSSHGCYSASAFRFSNLEMALGSELSGSSSLEPYKFAEYLTNGTNRFFVNLTNTSATNYAENSNDMDKAYLTKIKDDKVIMITDESTGTYLPGILNENIKNVSSEPSAATVATALKLSDLSGLTSAQQLAAKTAYLIFNTTLGAYGTSTTQITTAVASLYLMDSPGTDASWTGAKQVNEIKSWLVSGTSINIYLKSDGSVNAVGLTATYKLTDPGGTITTIATSTDNGKLYFAFPKASTTGAYSVTLSYTTGGLITSTVPSTSTFNYVPVPPLAGTPGISGTMQYGQILTVTPNVTNNTGTLSYQWKATGTNITNATGSTYTLTASEVGKTISCNVTSNVESGTLSATASGPVAKITLTPTVSAVNSKPYSGTTTTTGGTILFSGTVNSENPTYSATIVWTSANPGTSTVNVSGISLSSLTDRYSLSVTSLSNVTPGNNATIGKATPTVSVYPVAGAITYGQTLQSATLNTNSALVNGFSGAIAGSYAWKTSTTKPTSAGNFTTATVTFTPNDATNYNTIDFDISVTVSKASLTVTADAKTKVYGTANPSLTFDYSGWVNGLEAIDNQPTISTTVTSTTGAGTYTGAITLSGGSDNNYSFSYVAANFTVTKATLTATANNQTKVYGTANPSLSFQYSGWVNGVESIDIQPIITTLVTSQTEVGTYHGIITLFGGSDNNYSFSFVAGDLEVTKATLTVTADNQTKVYMSANPSLTFKYSGWVNGVETIDTPPTISTTVTSTTGAGTYTGAITLSGGSDNNYSLSLVAGGFEVTKATPTVSVNPTAGAITYGQTLQSSTLTTSSAVVNGFSGAIAGSYAWKTSTTKPTSAGNFTTATVTFTPADATNYNSFDFDISVTVTKATLTATAVNKTKVYGTANPSLNCAYSGWVNGVEIIDAPPAAATTVTSTTGAGTYTGAITLSGGSDNNYLFSYVAGDFEVTKATLTATADNKTKVYGTANPSLSFQYSGWVNGVESIDIQPIITTLVTSQTEVGTYHGIITLFGGSDNNYSFSFVAGDLEVTKATLTVTADNQTKVYMSANPSLTFKYSGWVNGVETIDTPPTISTTITSTTGTGSYTGAIMLSGGSDNNYSLSLVDGGFEVTKATLIVTADDQNKVYGDANPTLTFLYSGWKNGETETVLDTRPTASTMVNLATNVGTHTNTITVSGGADNNYDFSYIAANFTVTKATLTATADEKSKVYGEANPTFTLTYTGWKNSDDAGDITTEPVAATDVDLLTSVGIHSGAITVSGGLDENYEFSYASANFAVTKATLTVTADAQTKVYGAANPSTTFQYSGWKNGDDTEVLTTKPSASTTIDLITSAGVYTSAITVAGGVDENYAFAYNPADFTITKATLTATADAKSKVYGEANQSLSFQYSGWVNSDDAADLTTEPVAATDVDLLTSVGVHSGAITVDGGVDENYTFSYVPADLTVTKATLTASADAKTKVYGEANPELTLSFEGFKNNDDALVLDILPAIATTAINTTPAGQVPITLTGGSDNNYDFTLTDGSLAITKTTLVISSDNKTKVYGQENPVLTISWDGFVNGEDQTALIQAPEISVSTNNNSNAGVYPISLSGALSDNYAIEYNEGTLEVTKASLSVTAVDASKKYLEVNPGLTVTYSGFVNNDTQSVLNAIPSASTNANINSDAGTYDIIASGGSDNNYSYVYINGTLTIDKADQTITFDAIPEGLRTTQEFQLNATATSQLSVDFFSSEPAIATISGTDLKVEKEGTVQIIARQEGNHNWNPATEVIQTVVMLPTFDNIRSLFTPNNDGMNDTWYIPDIEQYGDISVQIYNRFGKLLYESSAYKNDWDGTYNGTPLPSASYYYLIKSSEKGNIKGVVNLVR